MSAYYNEFDEYPAQWLRNLIAAGHIAPGDVDTRSIADVQPDDLRGYSQCHFFAGIGGWSAALRLALWPDDRPVWTGSCPCQPFSVAGKQAGFADPRHLWPQFKRLIAKCDPAVVFGEQVAGAPDWIRLVRSDLEAMGRAVGAIPVEAASAGADHFRDRYWFVADRHVERTSEARQQRSGQLSGPGGDSEDCPSAMADRYSDSTRAQPGDDGKMRGLQEAQCQSEQRASVPAGSGQSRGDWPLADGDGERSQIAFSQSSDARSQFQAPEGNGFCPLVDDQGLGWGEGWTEHEFRSRGFTAAVASIDDCQYVECPDGKWRRLPPPRVRWLGVGIPARVAKLRALGNSFDLRAASQIIAAYLECRP